MIQIASETQTREEMAKALEANGFNPTDVEDKKAVITAQAEEPPPETPVKPEEKVIEPELPAEPGIKSATDPETAETTLKEPQAEKEEEETPPAPPKPPKSKAGVQARIDQLTRQRVALQEQYDEEHADKERILSELSEVKAQLETLKPKEAEKPAEPQRPKRPTRAEADFDDEKYEVLMSAYDDKMEKYHSDVRDQKITEALEADAQRRSEEARQVEAQREMQAYLGRVEADKGEFEDWNDVFESLPAKLEFPQAAEAAVLDSDHPGRLVYYFASDLAELDRLKALNPVQQVREIARLEIKLDRVAEKAAAAAAKPDKPAIAKPAAPEVTPKPQPAAKTPTPPPAPPNPVGGRAASQGDDYAALADKGQQKAFGQKLLADMAKRSGR